MEHTTFHIPFGVLRGLLPPDGERMVVWNGHMNQWTQNRKPFERHETAEIAFGRAIRAQQKHRDNERSMSPGITCTHGSLQLRGGWAAHKAVDVHNDYFDGEFNASVTLSMVDGQVVSDVSVPRLTWNESFVGQLGNLVGNIANKMVEKIRVQLEAGLQARLQELIAGKIDELLQSVPQATIAREHVSIELLPDQVAVTISYEKPAVVRVGPAGHLGDVASREVGGRLGEAVVIATKKKKKSAGTRALGNVARSASKGSTTRVKLT